MVPNEDRATSLFPYFKPHAPKNFMKLLCLPTFHTVVILAEGRNKHFIKI